jgi:hypothetical protein
MQCLHLSYRVALTTAVREMQMHPSFIRAAPIGRSQLYGPRRLTFIGRCVLVTEYPSELPESSSVDSRSEYAVRVFALYA